MARISVILNRKIAAAFDEAARVVSLVRHCESSGSDSPEELSDLSDLVNSFIESDCDFETNEHGGNKKSVQEGDNENDGSSDSEGYWSETKDTLKRLVVKNEDDKVKLKILEQVAELARRNVSDISPEGFKRRLLSGLRHNGFDAGLCKSRWEKFGGHPAGKYEYLDVNVNGTRYIIQVNLAGEFEIARPTTNYASLIEVFPKVFIGKPEQLKPIVRLMCRAMRESMKTRNMKMPPWRQHGYMQAKWFSHYKRTTEESSARNNGWKKKNATAAVAKRSVGFKEFPAISYYCRDNLVGTNMGGLKVGYLSAAFNANAGIDLQL